MCVFVVTQDASPTSLNVQKCPQIYNNDVERPFNGRERDVDTRNGKARGNEAKQGDLLQEHLVLETDDLDRAREFVSGVWEHHSSVMRRGRDYSLQWNEARLDRATVSFLRTPSRIHIECAPLSDCYRVTMHERGSLSHWINGYETVSTPTHAVIHSPGEELRLDTEPFQTLLLSFDGDVVREALIRRFGRVMPPESLIREFSLNSMAGTSLRSLCRWTARELDRPERGLLDSSDAVANLEGTLLTLFLDCLTRPSMEPKRVLEEVLEAKVARVEEWIDAHPGEAIRVDDLAQVASSSVRALENAFKRFRGCTPMEAVLRRRLIRARRILQTAAPGTTVTSVATENGFFHLGRFAVRYREAFGEPPSTTLRTLYPEGDGMARSGRGEDGRNPERSATRPRSDPATD